MCRSFDDVITVQTFILNRTKDNHPWRVAHMAQTRDEYIVALLHDVIEDGQATWASLGSPSLGLSVAQVHAINLLTRCDPQMESYEAYIDRICQSGDALAMTVKLYDLWDHLHPMNRAGYTRKRINRYTNAIEQITKAMMEIAREEREAA
jgi:(p)ppGpp synthase/HD superfamily hydrolase